MTLVYKKVSWEHPLISLDKPIFLAADGKTKKILIHKKYKPRSNERNLSLPLVFYFFIKTSIKVKNH